MTRTPEIDKLYEEVLDYRKTTDFKELIEFVSRFRHLSPYNAMLVHIQKPGSVYVARTKDWNTRFHRYVKAGARPLLILKPFGPVSFVYEYNDTDGEPLPDEFVRPFKNDSPVSKAELNLIIKGAAFDGIGVMARQYGTHLAGKIEYSSHPEFLRMMYHEKIYTIRSNFSIVLNESQNEAEQFTTMLHELGHFYCGHLNYMGMKWLPQRIGLEEGCVEFEAETVCWIVCNRLGIKVDSVKYLAEYLDKNEFIPCVSVDAIMKAAGIIESHITGATSPRKELIIKKEDKQITLFD